MSYQEFGNLRFLEFFPKTEQYSRDDDEYGSVEIEIGLACSEGGPFTFFAREINSDQTAVVTLDFDHDCPEPEGNIFLQRLGLDVCRGMLYEDVKKSIKSSPIRDSGPPTAAGTELHYVVGTNDKYYLDLFIQKMEGLSRITISRKDLVDRFQEWESSI